MLFNIPHCLALVLQKLLSLELHHGQPEYREPCLAGAPTDQHLLQDMLADYNSLTSKYAQLVQEVENMRLQLGSGRQSDTGESMIWDVFQNCFKMKIRYMLAATGWLSATQVLSTHTSP